MAIQDKHGSDQWDFAIAFACAISLRDACLGAAKLNLAPPFTVGRCRTGKFMGEVMRVGMLFQAWLYANVAIEVNDGAWARLGGGEFGEACIQFVHPAALSKFDSSDCLRVALRMRLPIRCDSKLPVPIDVRVPVPGARPDFRAIRIQTVRDRHGEEAVVPFTLDDDPFDEAFGPPYIALYGVGDDGFVEHIADRDTYADALSLVRRLVPEVALPLSPLCFPR